MRRIAKESGCGIYTIYRLGRFFDVEIKGWDFGKVEYVTRHYVMSDDAAIYKRCRNKTAFLANDLKQSKRDAFIRSCLVYIRKSRKRTIDEAVHVVGEGSRVLHRYLVQKALSFLWQRKQ